MNTLHKSGLCFFVITLSLCVYPIFLRVPGEISHVFGLVEIDLFSWYRMWLVTIFGIFFFLTSKERIPEPMFLYFALLVISVLWSKFIRTSIFGSPWNHEGLLAIVGYLGIYLITKQYGLFKNLEKALDVSIAIVFLIGIVQVIHGNFIGWLAPNLTYEVIKWPMYSTQGNQNHLGLFSALFFPYAYYRKKYVLLFMVFTMLICNQSRGSWCAAFISAILMGRKPLFYFSLAFLILSIPFYPQVKAKAINLAKSIHYPTKDSAFSGRGFMWKKSLPVMKHTLLTGNGPGTFALYFPQKTERGNAIGFGKKGEVRIIDRPHNMFINIWTSTGLISLILLIFGFTQILWNGRDLSLTLGALAFLICGLTTDSVLSVTPYFAIFLGAISHRGEHANNEKRRDTTRI